MNDRTELMVMPGVPTYEVRAQTSGNTYPADWWVEMSTAGSPAGVPVNGYTALKSSAMWHGVNLISGDVAQTPVNVYLDRYTVVENSPIWRILARRPNALQSPVIFLETLMQWALVWGNAVCFIDRAGSLPVGLIPLRPDCLRYERVSVNGGEGESVLYHYTSPTTSRNYTMLPDEVCHIQGLTSDGMWGYPLWEIANGTLGHNLALQGFGNTIFKNGARPSGLLKHPGRPSEEARANIRREFADLYEGVDNAGKTILLAEGIEYQATSQSNIDAQWVEAKELSVVEVASLLCLPAHKLNALKDSSVKSNLEEQNADYVQRTLARWFRKLSDEFGRKLMTEAQWMSGRFEVVWEVHEHLKPDVDTLSQVADRLVKAEIMNRNEARDLFRLEPYPGGEVFGSPAINPLRDRESTEGEPGEPPAGDGDETTPEPPDATEAHLELLREKWAALLAAERSKVLSASRRRPSSFVAWLSAYFTGTGSEPPRARGPYEAILESSVRAAKSIDLAAGRELEEALGHYGERRRDELAAWAQEHELEEFREKIKNGQNHARRDIDHLLNGAPA